MVAVGPERRIVTPPGPDAIGEQRPDGIVDGLWRGMCNGPLASPLLPPMLRTVLYRLAGLRVSLGARVKSGVVFHGTHFTMGSGSTLNHGCVVDNRAPVHIGRRCGIGVGVKLLTATHDLSDPECRAGTGVHLPLTIHDGAWVGSGATVLPGVTVGAGAVVAAGAVVTRDVAPNTLVAGIPARVVRDLPGHRHTPRPGT